MICRVGERTVTGRAVDLPDWLDAKTVATAVRQGRTDTDGTAVEITAREAGPLHRRVGAVPPAASIRPRTALAVAARSLGWTTPLDDDLAAARERLAAHEADAGRTATEVRRRLAETESEIPALRERVAEARGSARAGDAAGSDADSRLETAVRSLSEVETAAAAAREEHRAAREAARAERDRLERRLRLADEAANIERRARTHLVDRARDAYASALAAVPGVADPGDPFDAPPDAMALAVARVGDLVAPVVLACGRFECARGAARWLDAPVCRLDP